MGILEDLQHMNATTQRPQDLLSMLVSGEYGGEPKRAWDEPPPDLKMTPQELNLWQHHVNNLRSGQGVRNDDGSTSTISQAVVGDDGKYYSIPTVWGGKHLDTSQAVKKAAEKGWNYWPSYPTPDAADNRYINQMHPAIEMSLDGFKKTK